MQFLGWEDPLEKETATPRTETTGRLHLWGCKESDMIQHKRKIDFFLIFRKVQQIRRAFRNPNGPPFIVRPSFQQENVWHRQSHLEQAHEDSDLELLKGDSVSSLCTPRWPVLAVVIPKLKSHLIRSLESPWIVLWQSQFFLPPVEFFFLMFLFEFSFYHLSVSYSSLLQIHSNYISWKSDSSYHLQIVINHIFSMKLATKWTFLMQYNLCVFVSK